MQSILKPGIVAPNFLLRATNLSQEVSPLQHRGENLVLVFFPRSTDSDLEENLLRFEKSYSEFRERRTFLIGISDAGDGELRKFAVEKHITFPLLSDTSHADAVASLYGVFSNNRGTLPTVFFTDEEGLIRRVYEASLYPHLPNPAMVLRAIIKLSSAPRPAPVSESDWQLGPSDVFVTMIEYSDYQCSHCSETYKLLEDIVPLYKDKLRLIHRHLPLRHSHPLAQSAAEAAEAAGKQGKFWDMHQRMFQAKGTLERENLIEYAKEISLDIERFVDELDSGRYRERVDESLKRAIRNGIKRPPSLFINGICHEGPMTKEAICARIEELLACVHGG